MLIEFSCQNYKSIKKKVTLSMKSTSDDTYKDTLIKTNGLELSPINAIYGPNGAGKTNVINALGYMSFLVGQSVTFQHGDKLLFFPHKLSEKDKPSSFEIQFCVENIRYAYGFSLNQTRILEEYLYYFPKGRQAKIFERSNGEFSFGSKFKRELDEIRSTKNKENRLFIATAASWTNLKDIINPFSYLKDGLVINQSINSGNGEDSWLIYTLSQIESNDDIRELYTQIVKDLGVGITDISSKINKKSVSMDDIPSNIPEELRMTLAKSEQVEVELKTIYGEMDIDFNEESLGIQKILSITGPILDVLINGKVLVYDELEASLHPMLVLYIIEMFKNPDFNKNNAQLIFTTHDTNLLDLNLFRRDQIWLVEKNLDDYSSDLYSLSDLKNVRKDENIEKGYIRGKYGAVPFLGDGLVKKWIGRENG